MILILAIDVGHPYPQNLLDPFLGQNKPVVPKNFQIFKKELFRFFFRIESFWVEKNEKTFLTNFV